jgi:hypothetical protein
LSQNRRDCGHVGGLLLGRGGSFRGIWDIVITSAVWGARRLDCVGATHDPERKRNTILDERLRSAMRVPEREVRFALTPRHVGSALWLHTLRHCGQL